MSIQLNINIVTCPAYTEKFVRDSVVAGAPFLYYVPLILSHCRVTVDQSSETVLTAQMVEGQIYRERRQQTNMYRKYGNLYFGVLSRNVSDR